MKVTPFGWLSLLYVLPAFLDCFSQNPIWAHIAYVQLWLAIGEGIISVVAYLAFCMASVEKKGVKSRLGAAIYFVLQPINGVLSLNTSWRVVFIVAMTCVCINNQLNYTLVAFLLLKAWDFWPTSNIKSLKPKSQ